MGRRTAFRNHQGKGGLLGKSAFYSRVSSGQNNEEAFAFQKDRAFSLLMDSSESPPDTTGPTVPLVPLVPPSTPGGSFSQSFSESFSGGV